MKDDTPKLTKGSPPKAIFSMMVPMVIGLIVIIGNGLVDAYFIGQLGYAQLAAVSYAFPVWFILGGIVMGLGVGTASLASRAIGAGNQGVVREIATHAMILSIVVGLFVIAIGLSTIDVVFGFLGANAETMPYVREYMEVYYWGGIVMAVPMIGNSVMRASGDAKTPSILMATMAITNAVLDPILIFGWFGLPALGVKGAALASVLSNVLFLIASVLILVYRDNLIQFANHSLNSVIESWKKILHVGLPAIASNLIAPVSMALVTALISSYGQEAVAAYGLAGRLEALIVVIIMSLGGAMSPYVGQNFGAKRFDRLEDGFKFAARFTLGYSIFCIIFMYLLAEPLIGLFTSDPEVIRIAKIQLLICPWGYGFLSLAGITNGSFNALGKPMPAMIISISRTLIVYVPMAYLFSALIGIQGVFIAQVAANILAGCVGVVWYKSIFKQLSNEAEFA